MLMLNIFYFYLEKKKLTAFQLKEKNARFRVKPKQENKSKENSTDLSRNHFIEKNEIEKSNENLEVELNFMGLDLNSTKEKKELSGSGRKKSNRSLDEEKDQDCDIFRGEEKTGQKSKYGELPPLIRIDEDK